MLIINFCISYDAYYNIANFPFSLRNDAGEVCVVCGCWDMYQQYRTSTTATVHPRELVHCLSTSTQFKVGEQQCAAEFVQELVHLLGNATKKLPSHKEIYLNNYNI